MVQAAEFRPGNFLLQKIHNRILPKACDHSHFELMAKGSRDLYPVVLKAELLLKSGFTENMDYPLLPDAHEYRLLLPVMGSQQNEILAWVKNNGECFARAVVNGLPASNNIYQLHQLQNLYYALVGEELAISL